MKENKSMLMSGSMTYGLVMGIYWLVKYVFFAGGIFYPSLSLIYWGMTLAVPFIAYRMTRQYKQDVGGYIGFFHAWQFGVLLYFFAALIVSLGHYTFYRFIAPPDFVANTIGMLANSLRDSQFNSEMIDSLDELQITPIQMAIQGIFNNVFYGILLSLPIAAIVRRISE